MANDINRLPILILLNIGAFLSFLKYTKLNIVFQMLSIKLYDDQLVIYQLYDVQGYEVPISALLVQWFTTRQMFIGALVLFTLGTLVSGIAPDFSVLPSAV